MKLLHGVLQNGKAAASGWPTQPARIIYWVESSIRSRLCKLIQMRYHSQDGDK